MALRPYLCSRVVSVYHKSLYGRHSLHDVVVSDVFLDKGVIYEVTVLVWGSVDPTGGGFKGER